MDLGTVLKRLKSGAYASVADLAADVELIWSNAMAYNQDGSFVYKAAVTLRAAASKKFAPLLALPHPSSGDQAADGKGYQGGVGGAQAGGSSAGGEAGAGGEEEAGGGGGGEGEAPGDGAMLSPPPAEENVAMEGAPADSGAALAPGLVGDAVVAASAGLASALELPGDSEGAAPASLGAGFAEATLVAPMTGAASSDTAADGGGGDGQGEAAGVDGGEADGGEGEAAGVGEGGAAGVGEDGAADGS
jgi:hypothetical protein